MERRTFMIGAACCPAVSSGAWPWSIRVRVGTNAGDSAGHTRDTLAIVDRTLMGAASFVDRAARLQLRTFDTGDDIGLLWYTTLAPLVGAASAPALIGLTRASDYFVLNELLTRAGHSLIDASNPVAHKAHVTFAFVPRGSREGGSAG